jgi:hypothetical protein
MFQIRPAERKQAKLRLALIGVSGSGKSLGAINIAAGMGGKFVVIDTEHRSADLYANVAPYDVLVLDKPFTPEKYIQAIQYCEAQGYDTIIVDSLSHAWSGEGGALDMHDAATQASASKNSYMAWKEITPWQNRLINTIIQSKAHIIATLRVKTHYDVVDMGGKKKPIKLGLAPIQKEGMDYEFTTVLNLDKDSFVYTSSKDRTGVFEGKHDRLSKQTGVDLMAWLQDGKSDADQIEELKMHLQSIGTMDGLRKAYQEAIKQFPASLNDFLAVCTEQSEKIKGQEISNESV